jgi:hypothetical protein
VVDLEGALAPQHEQATALVEIQVEAIVAVMAVVEEVEVVMVIAAREETLKEDLLKEDPQPLPKQTVAGVLKTHVEMEATAVDAVVAAAVATVAEGMEVAVVATDVVLAATSAAFMVT